MRFSIAVCTLIAFQGLLSMAHAVPVAPGDAFATGPAFRLGSSTGTKIDEAQIAFAGDGGFGGVLTTRVYTDHPENPLGGLTFIYAVSNDLANPSSIGRASFAGFGLNDADVQYSADARVGIIAPGFITRDPNGDVIGFNFVPQPAETVSDFLLPGRGAALVVHTAATRYGLTGTASFIDGGAASVTTFAPVPEPSTCALLALGTAGLVARRRKWLS